MKVIVETEKESGKPPKKPYISVSLGLKYGQQFDARKQENLIVPANMLNYDMQNHLSISAYKSEKQYKYYAGGKAEKAFTAFKIILMIFMWTLIIISGGIGYFFIWGKRDPSTKFSYSFNSHPSKDLKIIIYKRRILTLLIDRI